MHNRFIILLLLSLVTAIILTACNNDNDDTISNGNGSNTNANGKQVVITIGNLTDQTGVASEPMSYIEMALDDMVWYYNQNNLIPGVELKVVDYDDQYDPARDIPGYKKLKRDGADFMWSPVTLAVPVLKPHLDADKFVMFTATANMSERELEGGYVFSLGITPKNEAYTILKWISENDENFPTDRPARIGAAAWNDGYNNLIFEAAEDYVKANPDKFVWDTSFLTEFKFNWTVEAEELKDCDYVFMPTPPHVFLRDFRNAGGTAKLLGTDPPAAFLGIVGDSDLWNEMDGSLFLRSSRWYNETGMIIDITNSLLEQRHSLSEANEIRRQGCGYIATKQFYMMLDIVRETVERVGAEEFSSDELYNTAINWQFELDGVSDFNNFTPTKRISQNYYAVYEGRASEENIFRIDEEWIPQVDSVVE